MAWENWKSSDLAHKLLWIFCSALWLGFCLIAGRALDLSVPYLPLAIAGASIFYLRNRLGLSEQIAGVVVSGCFALVVRFPHDHQWINVASGILALAGLGAFSMMGLRWLWSGSRERHRTYTLFAPSAALVFFVLSAQRALSLANLLYPKTYDLYLYVMDGSFGFQPSFLAARAMAASSILRIAGAITYVSLPFVMALVYALRQPREAERPSWDMITLFLLAGLGGWALYNIVPATGPGYVFRPDFPLHSLPYRSLHRLVLEQIPVNPQIPRNAIPSLHMAWVVLLLWNAKGLGRSLKVFLALYAGLTVLSTMGTGEHYFVDLVAALPLALIVQSVVSPGTNTAIARRAASAACGLGLTLFWLIVVRFALKAMLLTPLLPWALVAGTAVAIWKTKNWLEAEPSATAQPVSPEPKPLVFGASAGR
ncbi:MAG TPA: phosphatase PAP2 family protein [Terriglobales bacterium]|nr:phosphatase PAP2 family protein [Terriglobales bacterium]